MGYVYLLNASNTNHYKIGVTKKDVNKRVKQLQTGNANEIIVINQYESDNYNKLEGWMHRKFSSRRVEGEWFELSDDDVLSFIGECEKADKTITYLINENPFYN